MKLTQKAHQYLAGKEFSTGGEIFFSFEKEDSRLYSKIDLLTKLCQNSSVIHVGCVDHSISVIDEKIAKNKWLHKYLVQSASKVIGIDIEPEAIKYIGKKFGYDVADLDITKVQEKLKTQTYDYILLPDVIEHIGNPVDFLTKIRVNYFDNVQRLILTTPNAITRKNYNNAKNNREVINTDHRFWFTPYTLSKILIDSGYHIEKIYMINGTKSKKRTSIKNFFFKNSFVRKYIFGDRILTRGTIAIVATMKN